MRGNAFSLSRYNLTDTKHVQSKGKRCFIIAVDNELLYMYTAFVSLPSDWYLLIPFCRFLYVCKQCILPHVGAPVCKATMLTTVGCI